MLAFGSWIGFIALSLPSIYAKDDEQESNLLAIPPEMFIDVGAWLLFTQGPVLEFTCRILTLFAGQLSEIIYLSSSFSFLSSRFDVRFSHLSLEVNLAIVGRAHLFRLEPRTRPLSPTPTRT